MPIVSSSNLTSLYTGDNTPAVVPSVAYGNANVVSLLAVGSDGSNTVGNITSAGNISGQYFIGNGSLLTGIETGYGNANVESLLAAGITSNVITTANISGSYILGNGSQLTGLPEVYGNANVATLLANFGSNTISTTGNITGGNFIGSGAALTSITGANVTGTVANATYATSAGSATTATSATTAVTVTGATQANITGVGTLTTLSVSGNVTIAGDLTVSGNTYVANVTTLEVQDPIIGLGRGPNNTPLTTNDGKDRGVDLWYYTSSEQQAFVGYDNSAGKMILANNVSISNEVVTVNNYGNTVVGALEAATVSASGNITGSAFNGSGAGLTSIPGANISGAVANATYAVSAGSATTAVTVTAAAQPNITSVGTLTSVVSTGNITGGNLNTGGLVSATGNINGGNINTGGLVSATGAVVAGGNITGGNITTGGQVSATGNITGGNIITAGSLNAGSINATGNLSLTGNLSANNITALTTMSSPYITTTGGTGNITGANYIIASYFQGDGSGLTNVSATLGPTISVSGNITGGNLNTGGLVSATGAVVAGSFSTAGTASATGNITGGNLLTSGLLSATGNVEGGNIVINGSNIKSKNAWDPNTTPNPARITVGTGYNGDYSSTYDFASINRGSQLAVINKQTVGNADTNQGLRLTTSTLYADFSGGTLTNNNRRMQALNGVLYIGNGTQNMTTNGYAGASGAGGIVVVGNIGSINMGNAQVGHVAAQIGTVFAGGGGSIGNAVGAFNQVGVQSATGNVINAFGAASSFTSSATPGTAPTTVAGYYMPGATNTYGVNNSNVFRAATNYYFLLNDDDVAQNQLGSLRRYHTYSYVAATSGTVNIDKNNGQSQYIAPAGSVTIGDFQNFVTSASDGTNTDYQTDTVTVVVNQGATPYSVIMPTGNASIRYSGGVSTVSATANSTSTITITAYNNGSGSVYFVNIATTDAVAATGDTISPLMLMGG